MSPDFSNVYGEHIYKSMEDMEGVKVGSINVNNLCYVDDCTLIAESEDSMQRLLDSVVMQSTSRGLTVNIKKTVCMHIEKQSEPSVFSEDKWDAGAPSIVL